jgi:WD40 repeat protein
LRGHVEVVAAVRFLSNSHFVITAGDFGARIWDLATAKPVAAFRGHEGVVETAALSPDGARLLTAARDEPAKVWNVVPPRDLRATRSHSILRAGFTSDGAGVTLVCDDTTSQTRDVGTGHPVAQHTWHEGQSKAYAALAREAPRVAFALENGDVRVWDAATRVSLFTASMSGRPTAMALSPNGARLALASADKSVRIYRCEPPPSDVPPGPKADALRAVLAGVQSVARVLKGHTEPVHRLQFSADGSRIATSSKDRTTRIWEVETGRELRSLLVGATEIAFSPDGATLAVGSHDNSLTLWDWVNGKQRVSTNCGALPMALAFSPDGKHLALGLISGVTIVQTGTLGEMFALVEAGDFPLDLAFSPDGKRLIVTGSLSGTARIFDLPPFNQTLLDWGRTKIRERRMTLSARQRADFFLPDEEETF